MTLPAFNIPVLADKFEIRLIMVKQLLIEFYDIGISALVFRMTILAFFIRHKTAMIAFLMPDISRNFFMAILAQHCLLRLAKDRVAFFAIFFIFRMRLNHWPRHNKRFKASRKQQAAMNKQARQ